MMQEKIEIIKKRQKSKKESEFKKIKVRFHRSQS